MRAVLLHRVLAVLFFVIAVVLVATHLGTINGLGLDGTAQVIEDRIKCGRWDSNPHWANPPDPKSGACANSATPAIASLLGVWWVARESNPEPWA